MSKRNHKNYFAYRSFWKEFDAMRDFTAAGFNLFTIFPANTVNSMGEPYCQYKPLWNWYESYDFAPFDEMVNDILKINPNAEFLCMVDLNTPLWLSRKLTCRNVLGSDSFTCLTDALCSPLWRNYTEKYVTAFVDYAEKKYGSRIKAYIPACGVTDEWMDYTGGVETPQKLAAFQAWAKNNLSAVPQNIPCTADRFTAQHHQNRLRDPQKDAAALEYWKFHSELVAQGIIDFARLIKSRCLTSKDVGAFYGYINELAFKRLVQCGHLAYEKVLAAPEIDFVISPSLYHDRQMGGFGGFMSPNGTVHRYSKKYMHECDHRTSTFNADLSPYIKFDVSKWENPKEDVAGIRREFAKSLIHGTSLWMFDMWGGFYKGKEVLENLRRCKEIWEQFDNECREPLSEIAMIVDPASTFYVNDDEVKNQKFAEQLHIHLVTQLNKSGAPFSIYSFNDIPYIKNIERIKLFIFPAIYEITSEKLEILKKYVFNNGSHVMWGECSAFSDGKIWNTQRMETVCGVTMQSPACQGINMGWWTSYYMGETGTVTVADLKAVAKKAGVHLYSDAAIPVFASDDLLVVHSAESGKVTIRLPEKAAEIKELFEGKLNFNQTDVMEFEMNAPETLLFELRKI